VPQALIDDKPPTRRRQRRAHLGGCWTSRTSIRSSPSCRCGMDSWFMVAT